MQVNLRPQTFSEFKGNQKIKENLQIFINSSLKTEQPLDHCLFYGLPGTGKTSLAFIIANELKAKIKIIQGGTIQKPVDIINLTLSLKPNDILFIDEIHAINPMCVELLYSIMEDFALDLTLGKEFNCKTTRLEVPKFTLIGATTLLGKIPQPLQERFGIIFNIGGYEINDIVEILESNCKKLNLKLTNQELSVIAKNCKCIPRNAIRILKRVFDFKSNEKKMKVEDILEKLQILVGGLNIDDIKYLKILSQNDKPIGIKTLSQLLSIDPNTIETKIEPFLLANGYISKLSNGRIITQKAHNVLNKIS